MKKFFIFMFCLMTVGTSCRANDNLELPFIGTRIYLQPFWIQVAPVFYDDPKPTLPPTPKSPIQPPTAYLDEYTLYIENPNGYTIEIVNEEDDTVVYTDVIPAGVTTWQLPSTLSGSYGIRLITGNWAFVGEISL